MRDEKVHAVVTRSRSQTAQNTSVSQHFWKLRCGKCAWLRREAHLDVKPFWKLRCSKSARLCGTKHISKSKCQSRLMLQARLWCEAHSEVKSVKNWLSRAIFGSRMLKFAGLCGAKHISKQNVKHHTFPFFDVGASFLLAGAMGSAPCQKSET